MPAGRSETHRVHDSERHRAPVHDRARRSRGRARRLVRLAARGPRRGPRSETSRPRASSASRTCGPTSSSSGSTFPTRRRQLAELFRLRGRDPGTESRDEVFDGIAEVAAACRVPEARAGARRLTDAGLERVRERYRGSSEAAGPARPRPRTGVLRARQGVVPAGAVRHLQPRERRGGALRRKLAGGLDRAGPRLEPRGRPRSEPRARRRGAGADRGGPRVLAPARDARGGEVRPRRRAQRRRARAARAEARRGRGGAREDRAWRARDAATLPRVALLTVVALRRARRRDRRRAC